MTLAGSWGPVLLAIAFGLLSVPVVAISLVQPPFDLMEQSLQGTPIGWLDAVVLSLVSVVTASVVGGGLGGTLIRSRPVLATLVAIGTAWPVGIGMLPIAGAAFGIDVRMVNVCLMGCEARITDLQPISGFEAYVSSFIVGQLVGVPPLVFGLLIVAAVYLARRRRIVVAIVFTVAAYAALHVWSIYNGGGIAFICLAIGVITWALVLRSRSAPASGVPDPPERGTPPQP